MSIKYVRNINKDEHDRVEFLLVNFDYFDGNDLIAKLFEQQFGTNCDEKIEGMFYSIIRVHNGDIEYELVWHEDVGNYIYSVKQEENIVNDLEHKITVIVDRLNTMIK